ncbi:MAG: molybdopterin biosynthesis protein MoeE [Chloroflexi bacterium CG07_land_8_20_14_0_80_51_10]|nr:MAG: molybdopterin biosynthesis protein MoeE [Chloroflexi bacterium CG07_land_8_20_14_0_80_51_10]
MIQITSGEIATEKTIDSLRHPDIGAVMSYLGTVRSFLEGKRSQGLAFEVEDSTMQKSLEEVESEAKQRFDVQEIAIVHRTGSFAVGESILLIAISSAHRGPALDACRYIIDRIKDLHESWKREVLVD